MSIMEAIAVEELGYCCIKRFTKESKHISTRKLGAAIGVSNSAIQYWRDKYELGQLDSCPNCRLPRFQIRLELRSLASGRSVVDQCPSRSKHASADKIDENPEDSG